MSRPAAPPARSAERERAEGEAHRLVGGLSPRGRTFLWLFSIAMILTAGTAFVFKLYEFIHVATTSGGDALGSFLIPVSTYLIVAAGFACLFVWAYLQEQFRDVEAAKYRMLELDREEDARAARRSGSDRQGSER